MDIFELNVNLDLIDNQVDQFPMYPNQLEDYLKNLVFNKNIKYKFLLNTYYQSSSDGNGLFNRRKL
jgi:hypothetical protein